MNVDMGKSLDKPLQESMGSSEKINEKILSNFKYLINQCQTEFFIRIFAIIGNRGGKGFKA